MNQWYLAVRGQQQGPMTADEVIRAIREGRADGSAYVYRQGMATWTPLASVPEFAPYTNGASFAAPPPPPTGGRRAHEVDYKIQGEEMQFVEITLDPNETVVAEAGGMMFMSQGIEMKTEFGDPSAEGKGFLGKVLDAGKRVLTGESLFMTTFTARGGRRENVAFAAPYPGKIIALDLAELGREMICQKDSFLCAAKGVTIGIAFNRRLGAGFFGGEGFILQRLQGDGMAFVHAGGTIVERTLQPGETLRVDTGCLVALQPSVTYDIQFVGGFKNTLFGGEGLFFATLSGPGKVWLQSLPFSRLAGRIYAAAPQRGGARREEGSILGGLGGLLDGDNS